MLKQKKNIKYKSKKFKYLERTFRFRKSFKNNISSILNPTLLLLKKKSRSAFFIKINIRVKQNNVFCSLTNTLDNKIIFVTSSGKEKTSTSKKTLRFSSRYIISTFLKKIKKLKIQPSNVVIKISSPIRIKILIIRLLKITFLERKNIILRFEHKKCFNGCKPKKTKRKKRKGLRIFK